MTKYILLKCFGPYKPNKTYQKDIETRLVFRQTCALW